MTTDRRASVRCPSDHPCAQLESRRTSACGRISRVWSDFSCFLRFQEPAPEQPQAAQAKRHKKKLTITLTHLFTLSRSLVHTHLFTLSRSHTQIHHAQLLVCFTTVAGPDLSELLPLQPWDGTTVCQGLRVQEHGAVRQELRARWGHGAVLRRLCVEWGHGAVLRGLCRSSWIWN